MLQKCTTAIGFLWNVIYIKTMTQLTSTIHCTDTHTLFVQPDIFTLFPIISC